MTTFASIIAQLVRDASHAYRSTMIVERFPNTDSTIGVHEDCLYVSFAGGWVTLVAFMPLQVSAPVYAA